VNVEGTTQALELARRLRVPAFVFGSSSSVYGNRAAVPFSESDPVAAPISPYAATKRAGELLCHTYAHLYGLSVVSLRFFTVYGPRQRPDMAFTRFCRAVSDGREIEVYGTGEQVRDFTYVDDVVEANLQVGTADIGAVPAGSVFNVAGGSSTTVNEVLELLGEISGRAVRVVRGPSVLGDVLRTGGSTEAISKATGWTPRVGLREGLEEQYRWAAGV